MAYFAYFAARMPLAWNSGSEWVKIIIADDHPVVLMGVRALLENHSMQYHVVGEAHDGMELQALLSTQSCDLLITDFSMPGGNTAADGLPMIQRLLNDRPQLRVIVLTMIANPALIRRMLKLGVHGVVNKADLTHDLLLAVQMVESGRTYVSDRIRTCLGGSVSVDGQADAPGVLSAREAEIVRLFAQGLTVTRIAERAHRSVKTVSQQKNDAMRKLGLDSNAQLYEYARTNGLLS